MEKGEGLLWINEDINSDIVSPKGNKLSKQKQLIILGISLVLVVMILIIVIVISTKPDKKEKGKGGGGGKEEEKPKEEEEEEDDDEPYVPPDIKDDILGKIECIYDVDSTESNKILNENYNIPERTPEKVAKKNKFSKAGANNVISILYDDINMKNMFKGVSSIYSVKLISKKNCKLLH